MVPGYGRRRAARRVAPLRRARACPGLAITAGRGTQHRPYPHPGTHELFVNRTSASTAPPTRSTSTHRLWCHRAVPAAHARRPSGPRRDRDRRLARYARRRIPRGGHPRPERTRRRHDQLRNHGREPEALDAMWAQALAAGATVEREHRGPVLRPPHGQLVDPYGHKWSINAVVEEVSPEEMRRGWKSMDFSEEA